MAIRAVLVWVRSRMTRGNDDEPGDRAVHLAAEPQHDHQPEHDGRIMRDLRGRDLPRARRRACPRPGHGRVANSAPRTEPSITESEARWQRTSSMSRLPHHGVSSQSAAT